MSYTDTLYRPIYDVLAVPATVTIAAVTHDDLPVVDKTSGFQEGGVVDVATIVPAATVMAQDLVTRGLTIDDLQGVNITFNSSTWRISSSRPRPSPGGELDGEYLLFLEA